MVHPHAWDVCAWHYAPTLRCPIAPTYLALERVDLHQRCYEELQTHNITCSSPAQPRPAAGCGAVPAGSAQVQRLISRGSVLGGVATRESTVPRCEPSRAVLLLKRMGKSAWLNRSSPSKRKSGWMSNEYVVSSHSVKAFDEPPCAVTKASYLPMCRVVTAADHVLMHACLRGGAPPRGARSGGVVALTAECVLLRVHGLREV